ncbi:MAG: TonB-dependent receptor plug domain-containing protein, partial [Ignavibacteriales bacterium]|nr:TonB-dependent receptor plug domain-containing protein [Ignavibacteriales bacterium]
MWTIPGFFLRELGEPGQPQHMTFEGIDSRGISVQIDGRPLHDPVTGTYNLYDIPLEYAEKLEFVDGTLSPFYGSNASAATLNFVTHQYNNNRPLTKIKYLQGPSEHILSDGIFAQNVARGFNFMFGFQRLVTDGRFQNSKYDSWNLRSRLRYNYSKRLNFWLSDFYNKSTTGFNGGIDVQKSPSIFDEVTALVRTREAAQTVSR